jgi:hypothetical protein
MTEETEWLSVREYAKEIGMSPRTVTLWITEKKAGLIVRLVGFRKYQIKQKSLKGVLKPYPSK